MKRIVLDTIMLVLLIVLMSFRVFPKWLHEALGLVLPILLFLHLRWNRGWFSSLQSRNWRRLPDLVDIALLVSFLVATLTGLVIARNLFHGILGPGWERSIPVRRVHIAFSYGMLLLTGLHLGFHWPALWGRFVRWCRIDAASPVYRIGCRAAAILIAAAGAYASLLYQIGNRLLMRRIYGIAALKLPPAVVPFIFLAIIGLYTVLGALWARRTAGRRL
ncbi:MAG: DUF4405 domain-containing protein [Schwartzia sp.]|nr:DUF4405 domain-containing protein [Schwartzia sp. (in: firmicutes)]